MQGYDRGPLNNKGCIAAGGWVVSKISLAQKEGPGQPGVLFGPANILRADRRHKLYRHSLKFLTKS